MPLSTASEFIALSLIFNKLTGFYGVLALFTGYSLSPLQISQYILSLLALVALCCILPHVRRGSPFPNLALAWIYVVDTVVSIAYVAFFAVSWFLANFHGPAGAEDDTGSPSNGDYEHDGDQAAQAAAGFATSESAVSLVLVVFFNAFRVYFCFVVMAYARLTLRKYVSEQQYATAASADDVDDTTGADGVEKNIFAVGGQLGDGWRGKLGRIMVSVGKGYWLGKKEDEEWARNVSSKFRGRAVV